MQFATNPLTMKRVIFILSVLSALAASAQTEVKSFYSGANEGVTYSLPDTRIEVTLEATCIKSTPGEFGRYADRYLRIKNAINEVSSSWELNNVEVKGIGTPAADKRFTIKLDGSSASNITLDKEGIIACINTTIPEKAELPVVEKNSKPRNDASIYMTEEMLQATSTAKMAELAAKEIYTIRESKLALTRGQLENMPKDGEGMQFMMQELDKQEQALLELFTGRTDTIKCDKRIIIDITEECDTTKAVLLRFSRKLGFLDKDNLAGEPIYYSLRDLKTIKKPIAEDNSKKKSPKIEGICYIVPGKVEIEIFKRTKKIIGTEIPVAQLGTLEVLSRALFNKRNDTKVIFDTSTGGIISINK